MQREREGADGGQSCVGSGVRAAGGGGGGGASLVSRATAPVAICVFVCLCVGEGRRDGGACFLPPSSPKKVCRQSIAQRADGGGFQKQDLRRCTGTAREREGQERQGQT